MEFDNKPKVEANPYEKDDTIALMSKKAALIKDLEKQMEKIKSYAVEKKQDRQSLEKTMEAVQRRLDSVKQIEEVVSKRDY